MQIITREEFNAMSPVIGGDLWNTYKLCFKAFIEAKDDDDVIAIRFDRTSGLWCDVDLISSDGTRKVLRIYE